MLSCVLSFVWTLILFVKLLRMEFKRSFRIFEGYSYSIIHIPYSIFHIQFLLLENNCMSFVVDKFFEVR